MADIRGTEASMPVQITGNDEQYAADVFLEGGIRKLQTQATITVEEILGEDRFADSWFEITAAAASTNIVVNIGSNQYTIPITETDLNDAADECVTYLNSHVDFKLLYKARKVLDNPIVHIGSKFWAEAGEEDTFSSVPTGGTSTNDGWGDFKYRPKVNTLAFDPRDPRIGTLGISGQVSVIPGAVGNLFIQNAENVTYGSDMAQDGDPTPIIYSINAIEDFDILVRELRFSGSGNGIQFGQFLNINIVLSNGIKIDIKSDDSVITLPLISTTDHFMNRFALGQLGFQLFITAGIDTFLATFKLETPFPLTKIGTFATDDYIKVTIQDDIDSISSLEFLAFGFKQEF